MIDIPSAARRVAEDTRQGNRPLPDDMLALLPVLGAVAAGQDDAGRVERWMATLDPYIWGCLSTPRKRIQMLDADGCWDRLQNKARATIALAEAERKTASAGTWQLYEAARLDHEMAAVAHMRGGSPDLLYAARAALDAAVRRIAGVADGR